MYAHNFGNDEPWLIAKNEGVGKVLQPTEVRFKFNRKKKNQREIRVIITLFRHYRLHFGQLSHADSREVRMRGAGSIIVRIFQIFDRYRECAYPAH